MTGTFDFIREVITMAEEGQQGISEILYDVFPYCAGLVTSDKYKLHIWFPKKFGQSMKTRRILLKEWRKYFSDVHDLDHATDHRAFRPSGYRIIGQLKRLLQDNIVWKRELRTLFRESKAAQIWLNTNFDSGGYGMWKRRAES